MIVCSTPLAVCDWLQGVGAFWNSTSAICDLNLLQAAACKRGCVHRCMDVLACKLVSSIYNLSPPLSGVAKKLQHIDHGVGVSVALNRCAMLHRP